MGVTRRRSSLGSDSPPSWETLASSLKRHTIKKSVAKIEDTPFGTRYTIEGGLELPNGGSIGVRSVWFAEEGEDIPRLVTAYPLERKKQC